MMFWQLYDWKEALMERLDDDILDVNEWQKFIAAAIEEECWDMAIDMKNRLDYYRVKFADNKNSMGILSLWR